ncbi:MAG: hypothetical protein WCK47_07735 [bacterium]
MISNAFRGHKKRQPDTMRHDSHLSSHLHQVVLHACGLLLVFGLPLNCPALITHPGMYPSLQAAIDACPAGGEVRITGSAAYAESPLIGRNMTLSSVPAGATIRGTLGISGATSVTISGLVVDPNAPANGINVDGACNLRLNGCTVRRCLVPLPGKSFPAGHAQGHGVRFSAMGHLDVSDSAFDTNHMNAIHAPGATTVTVTRCRFEGGVMGFDTTGWLKKDGWSDSWYEPSESIAYIVLGGHPNVQIANCLFVDGRTGIRLSGAPRALCTFNTFLHPTPTPLCAVYINNNGGDQQTTVTNNIVSGYSDMVYTTGASGSVWSDSNIVANTAWTYFHFIQKGPTDLTAVDPDFSNAAAGDCHLTTSSPAIGSAAATGACSSDLENRPRPMPAGDWPDRGCFEEQSTRWGQDFPSTLRADFGFGPFEPTSASLGLGADEALSFLFSGRSEYLESGHPYDEYALKLAAQGMINRAAPMLWYDFSAYMGPGFPACSFWPAYYGTSKPVGQGIRFSAQGGDLGDFIQRIAPVFNGVVLYEPSPSDNIFLALNLASLNGCLPVSRRIYQAHMERFDNLPVVYHARANAMTRAQIYDWMLAEMFPRTDKSMVHSAAASFDDISMGPWTHYVHGLDYAFRQRGFIFNLSCSAVPTRSYNFTVSGDTAQAALFDRIMAGLAPGTPIFGWLEPEGMFVERVSEFGHYVNCSAAAPNLSFHASVKPLYPPPYIQGRPRSVSTPRNKCYVSVTINEGDAVKTQDLLYGLAWLDPARGQAPVNWPLNPRNVVLFPAMYEYLSRTRTEKDCLVAFPGYHGTGQNPDFPALMSGFVTLMPMMSLREVEYWNADQPAVETFGNVLNPSGMTVPPHAARPNGEFFKTHANSMPVLRYADGLHYVDFSNPGAVKARLEQIEAASPKPCFIPVYGVSTIGAVAALKNSLDPSRFEFVDYSTLFHLARQVSAPVVAPAPPHTVKSEWSPAMVTNQSAWTRMNEAVVSASGDGLRVEVAPGKNWAITCMTDVRLPAGVNNLRIVVTRCEGGGALWIAKLSGDLDGFGFSDTWLPFGNGSNFVGKARRRLDRRVVRRNDQRQPLYDLQIGLMGKPGDFVQFRSVDFDRVTSDIENGSKNHGGNSDGDDRPLRRGDAAPVSSRPCSSTTASPTRTTSKQPLTGGELQIVQRVSTQGRLLRRLT